MKKSIIAASCAAVLLWAAPASAAVMVATYTGTVIDGTDADGWFGTPGADLAGLAFSEAFTYDTAGAIYGTDNGQLTGYIGSIQSATVTLNGITHPFAISVGVVFSDQFTKRLSHSTLATTVGLGGSYYDQVQGLAYLPYTPPLPFETTFSSAVNANGCARLCTFFASFPVGGSQYHYLVNLAPTNVSITTLSGAVPEPAAWALMLIGFAFVGSSLRRRSGASPSLRSAI